MNSWDNILPLLLYHVYLVSYAKQVLQSQDSGLNERVPLQCNVSRSMCFTFISRQTSSDKEFFPEINPQIIDDPEPSKTAIHLILINIVPSYISIVTKSHAPA